jgi:hypothetical protein
MMYEGSVKACIDKTIGNAKDRRAEPWTGSAEWEPGRILPIWACACRPLFGGSHPCIRPTSLLVFQYAKTANLASDVSVFAL